MSIILNDSILIVYQSKLFTHLKHHLLGHLRNTRLSNETKIGIIITNEFNYYFYLLNKRLTLIYCAPSPMHTFFIFSIKSIKFFIVNSAGFRNKSNLETNHFDKN